MWLRLLVKKDFCYNIYIFTQYTTQTVVHISSHICDPNSYNYNNYQQLFSYNITHLNKTTNQLNIKININFTFILNIHIQSIKRQKEKKFSLGETSLSENLVQNKGWVSIIFSILTWVKNHSLEREYNQ